MITIIPANGRLLLNRAIKAHRKGRHASTCLVFPPNGNAVDVLRDHGYQMVEPFAPDGNRRECILRDYVDVIGRMSELNSRDEKWWASDLASKNRFTSPLHGLLNIFVSCADAIKKATRENKPLMIVNSSWPVAVALIVIARDSGGEVKIIAWPWSRTLARLQGRAMVWYSLVRGLVGTMANILRARVAFGWKLPVAKSDRPIYLIKSFVYPGSFSNDGIYRDSYFGELATCLSGHLGDKADVLTVALGMIGKSKCYANMRQLEQCSVMPLESLMNWKDAIICFFKLVWGLMVRPFRVPENVLFVGENISPLLREMLFCGGWKIPFPQYLHLKAAMNIAETRPVLACAMTYEGNPWERMFIKGLRRKCPDVTIIGYQHSVVPQSAAGMFLSKREVGIIPHPDRIVTTGVETADILKRYSAFPDKNIHSGCALRYQYLYGLDVPARRLLAKTSFTVLVALEGVVEVAELLSYAIHQASQLPDTRFNIRAHPAVFPLDKLLGLIGRSRNDLSANIRISHADRVLDDIKKCDAVLYWGTTVAVEALMMGRPLIHFNRGDILSYDPLFEFDSFKWTVDHASPLARVIDRIQQMEDNEYVSRCAQGRDYVKQYFHKADKSALMKFLPCEIGEREWIC